MVNVYFAETLSSALTTPLSSGELHCVSDAIYEELVESIRIVVLSVSFGFQVDVLAGHGDGA